jgi:hypothetical protein
MLLKIHLWQWPNVLAIDAALIAVAWQLALAGALDAPVAGPTVIVLALSVWLTYLADRLFDVGRRPTHRLHSLRHAFAKRNQRRLWRIWGLILISNIILALTTLSPEELKKGGLLLLVCLGYTALNQKLSRQFFPKEICVALIYTGGVLVFQAATPPLSFAFFFALVCLSSCLIIGAKEKAIDIEMQVHSLAPIVAERWLGRCLLALHITAILFAPIGALALSLSFLGLGLLQILRPRISIEGFRALADAWLLIPPLVWMVV